MDNNDIKQFFKQATNYKSVQARCINCILIIYFLIISSCTTNKGGKQDDIFLDTSQNKQIELAIKNWKIDTFGCLGYRNLEMVEEIILSNSLLGKTTNTFIEHFGNPNFEYTNLNERGLGYYFYSLCDSNQKINIDSDKGWIIFSFTNDTLNEIPINIAIE